eukprot:7115292-Pyramimonas_sp.AAC.1
MRAILEVILGSLRPLGGCLLEPLGALLGPSWGPLGSPGAPLRAILEAVGQKSADPRFPPPLEGYDP